MIENYCRDALTTVGTVRMYAAALRESAADFLAEHVPHGPELPAFDAATVADTVAAFEGLRDSLNRALADLAHIGANMAAAERRAAGETWTVTRDGVTVATFENENGVWEYMHGSLPYSLGHAIAHEGYDVTRPNGKKWSDTLSGGAPVKGGR